MLLLPRLSPSTLLALALGLLSRPATPPVAAAAAAVLDETALTRARALVAPVPSAQSGGEFEHAEFWQNHSSTLSQAWQELGLEHRSLGTLSPGFIEPQLEAATAAVRAHPNAETEDGVRKLWDEAAPGVYSAELLSPQLIDQLRSELESFSEAGIPLRRPNGMNRYGMILDPEVGVPLLDGLLSQLVNAYVRPMAAMLFPEDVGRHEDTTESFIFTIRYKEGEDIALAEHRDASVATLNINLNSEEAGGYGGSELEFVDEDDPTVRRRVGFRPGMALLHKGALRHAALPIEHGERQNLIIWLFGAGGEVRIAPYAKEEQLSVTSRWSGDALAAADAAAAQSLNSDWSAASSAAYDDGEDDDADDHDNDEYDDVRDEL